jgi:hypothetical protein
VQEEEVEGRIHPAEEEAWVVAGVWVPAGNASARTAVKNCPMSEGAPASRSSAPNVGHP